MGVLFVCVHGAGYSGLEITRDLPESSARKVEEGRVLAYDSEDMVKPLPSESVPT
jgi:hypothetical protein